MAKTLRRKKLFVQGADRLAAGGKLRRWILRPGGCADAVAEADALRRNAGLAEKRCGQRKEQPCGGRIIVRRKLVVERLKAQAKLRRAEHMQLPRELKQLRLRHSKADAIKRCDRAAFEGQLSAGVEAQKHTLRRRVRKIICAVKDAQSSAGRVECREDIILRKSAPLRQCPLLRAAAKDAGAGLPQEAQKSGRRIQASRKILTEAVIP